MNIEIVRFNYSPVVTLGWLHIDGLRLATLEEPWRADPDGPGGQAREGEIDESCVPDGDYELIPHSGTKWKNVWKLSNPTLGVYPTPKPAGQKWGRDYILIHSGRTTQSILGCILVGLSHGRQGVLESVEGSQAALDQLRATLGPTHHQLRVRPHAGTAEGVP